MENNPMYKAEVRVVDENDGMVYIKEIDNVDTDGKFTVDQRYLIPINDKENGKSVTYLRMLIPAGTHYKDGYAQIRKTLGSIHGVQDVSILATVLGIEEILA